MCEINTNYSCTQARITGLLDNAQLIGLRIEYKLLSSEMDF